VCPPDRPPQHMVRERRRDQEPVRSSQSRRLGNPRQPRLQRWRRLRAPRPLPQPGRQHRPRVDPDRDRQHHDHREQGDQHRGRDPRQRRRPSDRPQRDPGPDSDYGDRLHLPLEGQGRLCSLRCGRRTGRDPPPRRRMRHRGLRDPLTSESAEETAPRPSERDGTHGRRVRGARRRARRRGAPDRVQSRTYVRLGNRPRPFGHRLRAG